MWDDAIFRSGLKGQERAKKLLRRSISSGRLPHACLFRGPDGVGKTLFARTVAAALNCAGKGGADDPLFACGSCAPCRRYAGGNHPDFLLVSPEGAGIRVGQIRELIRALEFAPSEAATRVVVLEDVHAMTTQAANALLKTLEEPRPGNLFILTAAAAGELLPTIISRCQCIAFAPLAHRDVAEILAGHGVAREEAALLARLAGGSPGQALALRKFDIVPLWRRLVAFLSDDDKSNDRHLLELLDFADKMAEMKSELPALLALLRRWLRDLLLKDAESLSLYAGKVLLPPGKRWDSERLSAKLQALERAESALGRNCNRALVCEVLLFHLQA